MAAPSFDDLYDLGKAEMLIKRPDLFLNEGDISDFIVAAAAAMADKNIQYATEEARKTFIDTAAGADLTTLADDHWGIQRSEATAASVTLSWTRTTGDLDAGTIAAGTTVATVEDETGERQEYTTNGAVAWADSETGTKTVAATATTTGTDGNVGASTVVIIVDSIFDPALTVTNTAAAAGGNDQETDDELRERIRLFPSTQRRGTLAALEYGALTVDSVRYATATEGATGLVTVYVTDSSGGSTLEMVADVEEELENWRAAGTVLTVTGGSPLTQNVDVSLTVTAGTDVDALSSDMEAVLEARMNKLKVNETLYRSLIQSAIISVRPDAIKEVTVNTPAANIIPTAGELIRLGTFTVS